MIKFIDITDENYREICNLKVSKEQEKDVASSVGILARAYAYKDVGNAFAICNEDTIVGVIFYRKYIEGDSKSYILDQFMIDERFQGQGFGSEALNLFLEMLKQFGEFDRVILCYHETAKMARQLYIRAGFYHTEEVDEDEIIMEKIL